MSASIRVGAKAVIIEDEHILLVEYDDHAGLHYNLPGGGTKLGESIREGLKREILEETCAEAEVGDLLFIHEYEPGRNKHWGGPQQKVYFFFTCTLTTRPKMPDTPDPNQTGVKWINLAELGNVELLPFITPHIQTYARGELHSPLYLEEPLNWEKSKKYL